jgi:hypothetical protein
MATNYHQPLVGQSNAILSWMYMAAYWAVAFFVGWKKGYLQQLHLHHDVTLWHIVALHVTIFCQMAFNTRFDRHDRIPNLFWSALFAAFNGLCETFCFLYSYDLGRHHRFSHDRPWVGMLLGWNVYFIYNALIHAKFWLTRAFPPDHIKQDAPPFQKHGLPILLALSIAWLGIYEYFDDVLYVCFLHAIVDGWAAWKIALPGPWQKSLVE